MGWSRSLSTFDIKVRDHVAKLLHMLGEVRLAGDAFEPSETGLRKSSGDTGELVDGAEFGKATAGETEVGKVLGLVRWRSGRRFEALL